MSELLTLSLIFAAIRSATPLIFAALGGMFSERAGVINIALEGLMLTGAFAAAVATYQFSNPYLGFLSALLAGAFIALVYAVATIHFEADQVVAGTAINFLMLGLPQLISGAIYDSSGSTPQIDKEFLLPSLYEFFSSFLPSQIVMSILPSFLKEMSVAAILAFLLVPFCWYILYKTPFGLRLRAVGENPAAADSAGINVIWLRYSAVILSGVLAAAGGAYLSIGQSSLFTRGMSAGRGFIALAALILAKWKPIPVLFACLFFGFTEALTIKLPGTPWAKINGEDIPIQFIQIIPYVLTIIVLAGFIGLSRAPKALGIPYKKEN
jgi:general nucleoside transport system permease protein